MGKSKTTPVIENTLNYSTVQEPKEDNHWMDYRNKPHNQTRYVRDNTDRLVAGVRDHVTSFILN